MVLKIQKLSFWDRRWELVPFSWIQRGVGTALCVGQVFGVTQQQEAALLFLSLPETWEFGNCFGGREGTGRKWLLLLCPSLPIETASLAPQPEWQVPASMQTIPKSAILWQKKLLVVQHLCFQGPGFSLCILLRGAAQIRIRSDLGLTCVFSLCMTGKAASELESHQCSWQSSSKLLLLLCSCPLTLLIMDKLYPGRLASSTAEFLNV